MVRKGTCIHFNGASQHERCERGVGYEINFGKGRSGMFLRMPCIQSRQDRHGNTVPFDRRGETMLPCVLREEPTDEAVEKADREFSEAIRNTTVAMKLASQWRVKPKPDADRETTVGCPVCKTGELRMTQSAHNGHVHGRCSTEGCVFWME